MLFTIIFSSILVSCGCAILRHQISFSTAIAFTGDSKKLFIYVSEFFWSYHTGKPINFPTMENPFLLGFWESINQTYQIW